LFRPEGSTYNRLREKRGRPLCLLYLEKREREEGRRRQLSMRYRGGGLRKETFFRPKKDLGILSAGPRGGRCHFQERSAAARENPTRGRRGSFSRRVRRRRIGEGALFLQEKKGAIDAKMEVTATFLERVRKKEGRGTCRRKEGISYLLRAQRGKAFLRGISKNPRRRRGKETISTPGGPLLPG